MDYKDYRNKYQGEDGRERRTPAKKNGKSVLYAMAALVVMLCIIIAAMFITVLGRPSFVARSVTAEAGRSSIDPTDFLTEAGHTAEFGEGVNYDLSAVGEYKIDLIVDGKECTSTLIIVDTKAPTATAVDISVWQGSDIDASLCVTDIVDVTEVKVYFKKKPDTDTIGKHEVTVVLEDRGGNKTEYSVAVNVVSTNGLLYTHYVSELGDVLPSADVFTGKPGVGRYLSEISYISTDAAGTYMLQIESDGSIFDVVLEIADRTPPTATVTPQIGYNSIPTPESFISDVIDKSRVSIAYETAPVLNGEKTVNVTLVLSDAYGNKTLYNSYFTVVNDTQAPVILEAPEELEVDTGKSIIWRASVEASDDSGNVELELDTSKANLDVPGVYTVEIVARDAAGNETRRPVKLTVNDGSVTEEMLHAAIANIEKDLLLKPGMTAEEKIYCVFRYVYDSLKYSNTSNHVDRRHEAYIALSGAMTGDCFTYAACSYAILEYLGYPVHLIERAEWAKTEGTGTHFWVLVNIGTEAAPQWYHFDATPMRYPYNSSATYLMTNSQINAYTKWRNDTAGKIENYYAYDVEKYPAVSTWNMTALTIPAQYYE